MFGGYGKCCTYTILCFSKIAAKNVLRAGTDLSRCLNIITLLYKLLGHEFKDSVTIF